MHAETYICKYISVITDWMIFLKARRKIVFEGHIAPTLHCSQAFIRYAMTFVVGELN